MKIIIIIGNSNIIPDLIEYCHEEEIHLKKQSLELKNSSTSDIKKPNDIEIKFQLSKVSFQIEDETGAFKDKTLSGKLI